MLFLLQSQNGHFSADNETVRECIDFQREFNRREDMSYIGVSCASEAVYAAGVSRDQDDLSVPVGTLEFVNEYLHKVYSHEPVRAINIPPELRRPEWLKREVRDNVLFYSDMPFKELHSGKLYVKPALYAKQFELDVITPKTWQAFDEKNGHLPCFISTELKDIISEWRIFVFRRRIVGVKPYIMDGPIWTAPDAKVVQSMVDAYKSAPPAYTLDVAVTKNMETVVIEVHNLISCGLYGFEHSSLPFMLSAAFQHERLKK